MLASNHTMATRVNATTGFDLRIARSIRVAWDFGRDLRGSRPKSQFEFNVRACSENFHLRQNLSAYTHRIACGLQVLWKTIKFYTSWSITVCRVVATNDRTVLPSNPSSLWDSGMVPVLVAGPSIFMADTGR